MEGGHERAEERFTFVNDEAARRLYGDSAEERIGTRFVEIMTPERPL